MIEINHSDVYLLTMNIFETILSIKKVIPHTNLQALLRRTHVENFKKNKKQTNSETLLELELLRVLIFLSKRPGFR